MTAARWDRLAADLAAAGVPVTVDARPYAEAVFGRVQHGTTRSVSLALKGGRRLTVSDRWWRKNPDVWIGWEVYTERADGIAERPAPLTKKRPEVVEAVLAALDLGA